MSLAANTPTDQASLSSGARDRLRRTTLIAYAFLLPALCVKLLYTFWPILFGVFLAFTDSNVLETNWVGLKNFRELFGLGEFVGRETTRGYFVEGMWNSLKYLLCVPVIQFLSIGLAMLVNRQLPAIGLFRTAFYIPVVTSLSVVGLMWQWMYNQYGPISYVLTRLGLMDPKNPTNLLSNPKIAIYAVMAVTVWKGLGYYMVLYLAGLQAIDKSLEEAAVMDGAGRWRVFWHITLPGLRPTLLLCCLLSTISAIKAFEEIYVMTRGSSGTYTVMYFVFSKAFDDFRFGFAAAAGLVVAAVSLVFGLINFRLTRNGQVDG
jgi:putative chitobiose transport system permease protein